MAFSVNKVTVTLATTAAAAAAAGQAFGTMTTLSTSRSSGDWHALTSSRLYNIYIIYNQFTTRSGDWQWHACK